MNELAMKNVYRPLLMLMILLLFISAAAPIQTHFKERNKESIQNLIWHVKVLHPDGYTLDVKSISSQGRCCTASNSISR